MTLVHPLAPLGPKTRSGLFTLSLTLVACGGGERDLGNSVDDNPCDVPVDDRAAMEKWLSDEAYAAWPSEAAPHDSAGPHFGNVRTWVSPELEQSLTDGSESHPLCSVAVKELYGDDMARDGWSAMVKVADSGGSNDWYWYEIFEDERYAAGTGVDTCLDCHSAGTDMVRTSTPL